MTLHEVMHGFVAYLLGDDTAKLEGRLTLNPIKHIDPFLTVLLPVTLAALGAPVFGGAKPVPFNPSRLRYGEWGTALVAIAGPLTNLLIAFIFFVLFVVLKPIEASFLSNFITMGVLANLGFFIFNILPIPPLDGSRVLYAIAPDFIRNIMEYLERYGLILIFAIVMLANQILISFMSSSMNFILTIFNAILGLNGSGVV